MYRHIAARTAAEGSAAVIVVYSLKKSPEHVKRVSGDLFVIFDYIFYSTPQGKTKSCKNICINSFNVSIVPLVDNLKASVGET